MSDIPTGDWSWINKAADRFERAWRCGPRPRIEDFLAEAAEPLRGALLDELLRVECEIRRGEGERPTSEEYLPRFPGYSAVIRAVFGPAANQFVGPGPPDPAPSPTVGAIPPGLDDHPDFQVVRRLGSGSMGLVYLARNRITGREEVLKVISRDLVQLPGALDRFLREIRAVARLQHANIVTAYSAFRVGDGLVLAMEYVEGLDLARLVKAKGPLPVGHACSFVHQAALGLQHAHEAGLVHRDIKPSNLMLARERDRAVIKVLDFGLARVVREQGMSSFRHSETTWRPSPAGDLTMTGEVLGTPAFISPEQIAEAPSADIRADIYSLGCTLYFLLVGRPPFRGPTLYDVLRAHRAAEARPLNLERPEVPFELAALVAKMMAKQPGRRFQTPAEVAWALAPFFRKSAGGLARPGSGAGQPSEPAPGIAPAEPPRPPSSPAPGSGRATGQPEPSWENLINFEKTENPEDERPETGGREDGHRRGWYRSVAAAVVLSLGLLVVCRTAGVVPFTVTRPSVKKSMIIARDAPGRDGAPAGNRPEPTVEPMNSTRGADRAGTLATADRSAADMPTDPKPPIPPGPEPADPVTPPTVPLASVEKVVADRPSEAESKSSQSSLGKSPRWEWVHDVSLAAFIKWVKACRSRGYRPVFVNTYCLDPLPRPELLSNVPSEVRVAAIAVKDGRSLPFEVRLGEVWEEHNSYFREMSEAGYYLSTQTCFYDGIKACVLAVYTLRAPHSRFYYLTPDNFDSFLRPLVSQGYHPFSVAGYPYRGAWRLTVGTRMDPGIDCELSRSPLSPEQLQQTLRGAKEKGLRPESLFHCPGKTLGGFGVVLKRDSPDLLWEVQTNLSPAGLDIEMVQRVAKGYMPDQVVGYPVEGRSRYLVCWTRDLRHYPASGLVAPPAEAIDEALEQFLVERRIPSGTIAVFLKGDQVLSRGYGQAAPTRREPTSPDAKVSLGSLSTPFAAAAVRSLIAKKKLREGDRLTEVLRKPSGGVAAPMPGGEPPAVTVGGLLDDVEGNPRESLSLRDAWLGRVLEAATGKTASQVVASEVLQPLKLKLTPDGAAPGDPGGLVRLAGPASDVGRFFSRRRFDGRQIPAAATPPNGTLTDRQGNALALVLRRDDWLVVTLLTLPNDAPPGIVDDLRECLDLALEAQRNPTPSPSQ
jgi:serine/threonine protein kinase